VSLVDLAVVVLVVLLGLGGFRRGLVVGLLSLGGLVGGVVVGAQLAPRILGEDSSRYAPLIALCGAIFFATIGQALGVFAGRRLRGILGDGPLRAFDNIGGFVLGALTGLVVCWALGAVFLYLPGQVELRRYAQDSAILSAINGEVPPARLMDALARVDPFSQLSGPGANVGPPDPALAGDPDVAAARAGVVRIVGYACGLGIEGSGWIAEPGVVVTNAHVVAGLERPLVDHGDGDAVEAVVVVFDPKNDVAVLSAPGLRGRPLRLAAAPKGAPAAMLGFPGNGPYTVTPVRIGRTQLLIGRDAYGRFPVTRGVTSIRGDVRSGNSGGPVVDGQGRVLTTIFGKRSGPGPSSGYGVPTAEVQEALSAERRPLSTACSRQ
jgi:S1-C subfamily serine protease